MTRTKDQKHAVALVTGAAKRLGREIALRLADEGFDIALHFNQSRPDAERTQRDIESRGRRCFLVEADLADPAAVATIIPKAVAALGPVTLLVNSASVFADDRIGELEVPVWNRTFSINLRAPVMLAQDMAHQLGEGVKGAIINIIDQKIERLNPQFFIYTLTKSALWTATQTMAQALAPAIRVNAVSPGPVLANLYHGEAGLLAEASLTPLGEKVDPAEIAEAVSYLAHARSVTGQMIFVDGGQHIAWHTPDVVGDLTGFRRKTAEPAPQTSGIVMEEGIDEPGGGGVDAGRAHQILK